MTSLRVSGRPDNFEGAVGDGQKARIAALAEKQALRRVCKVKPRDSCTVEVIGPI
jgi:hypothetical protein